MPSVGNAREILHAVEALLRDHDDMRALAVIADQRGAGIVPRVAVQAENDHYLSLPVKIELCSIGDS